MSARKERGYIPANFAPDSLLTPFSTSLMTPQRSGHVSVLPAEVLALLAPAPGETWVDATTGAGGHALAIAQRIAPAGQLIAIDQDPQMLELARPRLAGLPVRFLHANFDQLHSALSIVGLDRVDGLLADLGFCSDQLENRERGFSFQHDGPLDMRLDPTQGESAAELLHRLEERELANIIFQYGEERHSRRVARQIVEMRKTKRLETTLQLADLVRRCVPRDKKSRIDPATRTFQGLRIAVNDELGSLERLLAQLPLLLKPGGRVGIISFHSLEDRLVKQAFRDSDVWEIVTKKPVTASEEEVQANPRSRSAKLRVAKYRL